MNVKYLAAILLVLMPATVAVAAAWQIDIETPSGGPVGNGQQVTANFDPDGAGPIGSNWNSYIVQQITNDYNDPNSTSSVDPPALANLVDSHGNPTAASFDIIGEVQGYNTQITDDDVPIGGFYAAVGDHLFFAQGDSDTNLGFAFTYLPPAIYRVTAYSNPTYHVPTRGFTLKIADQSVDIIPAEFNGLASPESITGRLSGIAVGSSGELTGELRYLAGHGDPSVAAIRLEQIAGPNPLGDFNFDGTTNAADYTIWRDHLGSLFTPDDYAIWKSHFNGPSATAMPELSTIAFLLSSAIFLVATGRRLPFGRERSRWAV
jgi:hypothetical protein